MKKENYEDYSSGRVIYGAPMATNFPVGLTLDIYEKCSEYLSKKGNHGPYKIYDPFCGVAYSLTVQGFFNGKNIKEIIASDIDKTALEFAHKNLSLLNTKGMSNRIKELKKFIKDYQKDSHKKALISAEKLKDITNKLSVKIVEFQFDILSSSALPKSVNKIDMVITDVPYGKLTNWVGLSKEENPVQIFLNKIKHILNDNSVVAIVLNKKQVISFEGYAKVKSFKLGKRKILILSL